MDPALAIADRELSIILIFFPMISCSGVYGLRDV